MTETIHFGIPAMPRKDFYMEPDGGEGPAIARLEVVENTSPPMLRLKVNGAAYLVEEHVLRQVLDGCVASRFYLEGYERGQAVGGDG